MITDILTPQFFHYRFTCAWCHNRRHSNICYWCFCHPPSWIWTQSDDSLCWVEVPSLCFILWQRPQLPTNPSKLQQFQRENDLCFMWFSWLWFCLSNYIPSFLFLSNEPLFCFCTFWLCICWVSFAVIHLVTKLLQLIIGTGLNCIEPEEVGQGWPLQNQIPGVVANWFWIMHYKGCLAFSTTGPR